MAYMFKHGDRPLDDYTIQRAVGSGGFGEVYYAVSDGGREVALKYLRENPQTELRGVSHCINLKSPHLVSIFDIKKNADGDYFIIMEYCSGPSLRDLLIAEPDGLGKQKAAFFVREIAKGIGYLHDRGIVHRDLKPGNIFYDDGYVKICDYGLSKFISVSRHSAQTASVGTVHYMAPEIGSGDYSRGVDIYALGVVLYEMLLGKVPFEGSSMGEILMKHLTSQPEVENLPEPFGKVIRKALEKDPKDRYQTVDEMVEDLLDVEDVKQSLAGFSPKSLDGAVRAGSPYDSPMPSPNPAPAFAQDFRRRTPPPVSETPPFATPLPDRLATGVDRVARKVERKMRKLEGKHGRREYRGHHRGTPPVARPSQAELSVRDRRKRRFMAGVMTLSIAGVAGVAAGLSTGSEDIGGSTFFVACMMALGLVLSRRALDWLSDQSQPEWAQRFVRLACCGPLIFLGCAPMLGDGRYDEIGLATALGLCLLALMGNWKETFERGADGELCIWSAIWRGVFAAIATAFIAGMVNCGPNKSSLIVFLVIAAVSIIIQTTSWWLPRRAPIHADQEDATGDVPPDGQPPAPVDPNRSYADPIDGQSPHAQAAHLPSAGQPMSESELIASGMAIPPEFPPPKDPMARWGVTRALWGLCAFALMGVATLSAVAPIVFIRGGHARGTALIVVCIACVCTAIYSLAKTTARRREGFWRETARPMLICLSLFALGASATYLARENATNRGRQRQKETRIAVAHTGHSSMPNALSDRFNALAVVDVTPSLQEEVIESAGADSVSGLANLDFSGKFPWQVWRKGSPEELAAKGMTVFVDYTATWCVICQANRKSTTESDEVRKKMDELNVVPITADNTRKDPEVLAALSKFGRVGVPLNVIYPAGKPDEPIVLPIQLVGKIGLVLDKLDEAGPSKPTE